MMKKIFFSIVGIIVICFGFFYLSKSRSFQFFGGMVNSIKTDKNMVALTFDDGPTSGNSERVLEILARHAVKASFFVIGQEIEKCPECLKSIIEAGHQVGNHSYSHQRMVFKTPSFIQEEIKKTDELIRNASYSGEILFRTPYGKRLFLATYYLWKYRKPNVFFDVEPETYVAGHKNIVDYVLQNTHSGSIILLHPMYGTGNQSLAGLDEIISSLKARGFQFVTVDELMKATGVRPNFWFVR
ncbi:MAG TPA: polysaccharide deacetylase family protein [Candidatus Absconditabacterales bacterium]|nr:polysaccharide deacetylase family protein [Candidatus Absconditabacterales bacterium]